jgi:uncharacterized membrane protein
VWVPLLICALGGLVIAYFGFLGFTGKLKPNPWAGIRTPYTMSSPERWYDTHRGGGPLFVFGGVLVFSVGAAFLPFAIAGAISKGFTGVIVIVLGLILVSVAVFGWQAGVRYARAQERGRT